jgi:hypothetical protein
MEQFDHQSQLSDASSTQRDASQDRYRRRVARLNRLNQSKVDDARCRAAQIKAMIADFGKTIIELDGWIEAERTRPGVHPTTLATSLTQRRDTLRRSIEELKRKLGETRSFATEPPERCSGKDTAPAAVALDRQSAA